MFYMDAPSPAAVTLTAWTLTRIAQVLVGFGAGGGIVAALSLVPVRDILTQGMRAYGAWTRVLWCLCVGALIGAGSALGFGIILATDDKFDGLEAPEPKVRIKAQVIVMSSAVIAGFAGLSVLKRLSNKFGEDIDRLSNEINDTRLDLAQEKQQTANLASGIGLATLALGKTNKGPTNNEFCDLADSAIEKLEEANKYFPQEKTLAMFLGRLHRWKGDLSAAMKILEDTLEARRKAHPLKGPNEEDASMLYNLACYLNLHAKAVNKANETAELQKRARASIDKAISICPDYGNDAAVDPDLADLP